MRLTRISVEGCGRFVERASVSGLAPGLNVLSAPNESGKSTLFRAVRACLFEKHTSKTADLRALASEAAHKPLTIEVGFVHGDHEYVALKTFLSGQRARLLRDGREIAGGRHADEALHDLLGLRPGGRGVDEGAFGLLWVRQSESFRQPEVNDAAREGLESAIEREVGALVGGERARDALKAIETELAPLVTQTGLARKGGPLAVAEERARALGDDLDAARRLLAELEADFDLMERKRRERTRLADPAEVARMREKLQEAAQELAAAEDAAREIERLTQAERLERLARDEAARTLEELRACARDVDEALDARAALAEAVAAADARRAEATRKLEAARARLADIEAEDIRHSQEEARLRRLANAAAATARLNDLDARAARLAGAEAERDRLRQALAPLRASARHVQALDKIAQERAALRAQGEAVAPRVVVTPTPGADRAILLDGRPLAAQTSLAALERTVIAIPGVGEIVVEPPARQDDAGRAGLIELDAKHARVLADTGLDDERAVRAQAAHRAEIEAALAALAARIAALGSSDAGLTADLAALRAEIETLRAQAAAAGAGDEAAADQGALARAQDAVSERRRAAALARSALNGEIAGLTQTLLEAQGQAGEQRAQAEALTRRIETGLQRLPTGERAARLTSAGAAFEASANAHRSAALALEQAQARAPTGARLDQLRERVARLTQAVANHESALHALDQEIATIGGRLQSRGGEGLAERVAALGDEHDLATRDVRRARARTDALTLLKNTILACYEERRDKLQTPLRARLQPLLDDVFPGSRITLDERFAVERVERAGASERFDTLSAGAQEQIAILVRLAMGALLHERGEDVPIILDDALVFCDDERIEHMFDALNRAARTQQVIVLTCRGTSFRSLGGAQLTIEQTR